MANAGGSGPKIASDVRLRLTTALIIMKACRAIDLLNRSFMKTRPRVCDLAAALVRMGSNIELAREMLTLFREDAPVFQSRLNVALASGDSIGVQQASHSLRGMLCMFGAEVAMQVAFRLEQMGIDGDLTDAQVQTEKLDSEITRFLKTASTRLAKL
jgi:HPt (histidine-containing phosphotransfer) domain-containing protein